MRSVLFILSLILIFNVSFDASANPLFGEQKFAIYNGQAAESEYSAVVSLNIQAGDMLYSYCSGVLIRENVVLTAAHCLENEEEFDFEQFYNAGKIRISTGQHVHSVLDASSYDIDHFVIHPQYSLYHHDLALIFLENPILAEDAVPMEIYEDNSRFRSFAQNRQNVEFVGYGTDELDGTGNRLMTNGEVSSYCPNAVNDCGFTVLSKENIVIPTGAFVHEISSGGPCRGDSGGPVILKNNVGSYVLGIVSYGDADCSMYSVSISVADHIDWIRSELGEEEEVSESDCSTMPMGKNGRLNLPISLILLGFLCFLRKKKHAFCCQ